MVFLATFSYRPPLVLLPGSLEFWLAREAKPSSVPSQLSRISWALARSCSSVASSPSPRFRLSAVTRMWRTL